MLLAPKKTFYWSSTFLTQRNKIYSLNTNEKWVISIQLKKIFNCCLHSHHSLSLSTRDKFSCPSRFSAPGGSPRGATVPLPPVAGRLPRPQHQGLATGPTGECGHLAETVQKHAGHRPLHVRPNFDWNSLRYKMFTIY